MLIRHRMNRIIRLLKKNDFDSVKDVVLSEKYRPALVALEEQGCVKLFRSWDDGDIRVKLLDHHVAYQLSQEDKRRNLVIGFILGVIATVVASVLTGLLPPVLEALLRYIQ